MAETAQVPVHITLRPYASSIPLASFAFGIGNILYAAFLLRWIPQAESHTVALMLLAFVAPLELIPSLIAFVARDTGGATAFGIFGAAWIVQGLALLGGPAAATSPATAIFLGGLGLSLIMLTIVTMPGKPLMGAVLIVAVVRTSGAAAGALVSRPWLTDATAWCGVLLGVLAFYAGVAFLVEDVTCKLSPLTLRTGEARRAMEGRLEDQLESIEREAGVRKQL